ncbi:hypothetical protein ACU4HD_15140 [Cupriavidus basilensis]
MADMDTPNIRPFLDTLAVSELGRALLAKADNGYNVLVGSTPDNPLLFRSYAGRPRKLMQVRQESGRIIPSTAAGRYQLLAHYYAPTRSCWAWPTSARRRRTASPCSRSASAWHCH